MQTGLVILLYQFCLDNIMEENFLNIKKVGITLLIFIISAIVLFTGGTFFAKKVNKDRKEWIKDNITVQFHGRIISKKAVNRGGRDITIGCIKVNYSNTDSIIIQNKRDYIYLKIQDSIATFVLNFPCEQADSVSINMENNRVERYYKNGELFVEYPLSLRSAYATDEDLKFCDK